MEFFFGFLLLLLVAWMLVGMVKPAWALRWGQKRTRLRVIGWYIFLSLVVCVWIGIFVPKRPEGQPAGNQVATPDPVKQAVVNREKIDQQTEAGVAALAAKQQMDKQTEEKAATEKAQADALAKQKAAQVKTTVRMVREDLLAADRSGSDAAGFARSMLQKVGKGVSLGDVYGAFKAAKLAADESFSRLMQYRVPQDLPKDVRAKLDEAHKAFRSVATLRSQIATSFMEWLDTHKPSLENAVQEKSNQVTLAMAQAIISLTEAMQAAGLSDDEVKAELAVMAGNEKPSRVKSGK